jgi:malonate decarboxylase beta subunit
VHGAKIVGVLERARDERPHAVLLLIESGGVRLQEANAGLIAVSEIMRAILAARSSGITVIGAIGGALGCFGGMAIAAACCDALVMSEEGRIGLSGPEVIETVHGVEEFDSRDRPLVWRTVGGKHRYLLGDCARLCDDDVAAFRDALLGLLGAAKPLTLESVEREHRMLSRRLAAFGCAGDAHDIWSALGFSEPDQVSLMPTDIFLAVARTVANTPRSTKCGE